MVTSSPVALALGMEEASSDIMTKPPRAKDGTLWTKEFIVDTGFYGAVMGVMSLWSFFLTASVSKPGYNLNTIPEGCNSAGVAECDYIYTSRAVAFYSHCLLLLVHGLNCRHTSHSMFSSLIPPNKYIWYSLVVGLVLVLPTAYMGDLSGIVFTQGAFDWQWGIVVGNLILFLAVSELYKGVKRWTNRLSVADPQV